jgi:hypothetical protein
MVRLLPDYKTNPSEALPYPNIPMPATPGKGPTHCGILYVAIHYVHYLTPAMLFRALTDGPLTDDEYSLPISQAMQSKSQESVVILLHDRNDKGVARISEKICDPQSDNEQGDSTYTFRCVQNDGWAASS